MLVTHISTRFSTFLKILIYFVIFHPILRFIHFIGEETRRRFGLWSFIALRCWLLAFLLRFDFNSWLILWSLLLLLLHLWALRLPTSYSWRIYSLCLHTSQTNFQDVRRETGDKRHESTIVHEKFAQSVNYLIYNLLLALCTL